MDTAASVDGELIRTQLMAGLLEAGNVVLRHRVGVRLRTLAGFGHVRVNGFRMEEAAAVESGVVDPEVLATLAWLPSGPVVRVGGEGG
jgi:hypothetical protein